MERSISITELSTENGVPVVNSYGSIIIENEDHVDDSTTEVCWYLYVTTVVNILCSVWKSKSWSDLFCLLISILIDPTHFGIERTATVKASVFHLSMAPSKHVSEFSIRTSEMLFNSIGLYQIRVFKCCENLCRFLKPSLAYWNNGSYKLLHIEKHFNSEQWTFLFLN